MSDFVRIDVVCVVRSRAGMLTGMRYGRSKLLSGRSSRGSLMSVAHTSRSAGWSHRFPPLYLGLTFAFGLLAWTGLRAVVTGGPAFGAPWSVAGLGGAIGSSTLVLQAWLAARPAGGADHDPHRFVGLVRAARVFMLIAAMVTAVLGILLAPTGDDERGFVMGINLGLAAALGLYASLVAAPGRRVDPR